MMKNATTAALTATLLTLTAGCAGNQKELPPKPPSLEQQLEKELAAVLSILPEEEAPPPPVHADDSELMKWRGELKKEEKKLEKAKMGAKACKNLLFKLSRTTVPTAQEAAKWRQRIKLLKQGLERLQSQGWKAKKNVQELERRIARRVRILDERENLKLRKELGVKGKDPLARRPSGGSKGRR